MTSKSICCVGLLLWTIGCAAPPSAVSPSSQPPGAIAISEPRSAWTPAMQMTVRRVTAPRLSPSGGRVVFQVADSDLDADRWAVRLYVGPADGGFEAEPLDRCAKCRDAQWGGDDRSLVVRAPDEAERDRLHVFALDSGTLVPITPEDDRVGWFQVSPDGAWIAYTTLEANAEHPARWRLQAIHVADGRIVRWNLPESVAGFSWSPTADRIAVAVQPAATLDWREKSLALLDLSTGDWMPLVTGPGAAWAPQFGPEGRRVAFVASPGVATWMRDAELRVLDLETEALTVLAPTPDRNVDLLAWHPSGDALLGLESQGSTRRLISVSADGEAFEFLGPDDRSIRDADVSSGRIAFTSERWNEPPEVFVADWPDLQFRQISSVQPAFDAPLGRTTTIRWVSDDGVEVEGLLTYPTGQEIGTRVPLLVRLHGGPPFPASDGFLGGSHLTAYPLASLASAGFAVLQPNFRGSAGYGRTFRHDLHGDWGGQDYRDVMSGVDALVERGIADPDRLGVMGWSFGGYLTAWTITQTNRFAAASMGAAMTNLAAFDETTSLSGMLGDWFGEPADTRLERYRQRSPITHARNVTCPVLLQHGMNDTRVPIAQAHLFASALEASGVEHDLQTYEGGHGPRTPRAELAVLEQNFDWFLRTLGRDDGSASR
ncbi:MAG: S9 family peptidase [Acidobacteriota bacterium]